MEISQKSMAVISQHKDEVYDVAKRIYSKNTNAANNGLFAEDIAISSIENAATFVDLWHKAVG